MPLNNPKGFVFEKINCTQLDVKDSGDLEAGTLQIRTRTTEQGTPDYSYADAYSRTPDDPRFTILGLGVLIQLTLALQGATTLINYRVKVNGTSRATGTIAASGYILLNLTSGQFALTGGQTIELFLWPDHNDGADITLCRIWDGCGTCTDTYAGNVSVLKFVPLTGGAVAHYSAYVPTIGGGGTMSINTGTVVNSDQTSGLIAQENGISNYHFLHIGPMPPTGIFWACYPSSATGMGNFQAVGLRLWRPE